MKRYNEDIGQPRLADGEFRTNFGKGNSIFIGSSTDMFAENIPSEWIVRVLDFCLQRNNPEKPNTFLLQSKNPKRFLEFIHHPLMDHVVFGTTIETNRFYPEIMNKAPKIEDRVEAMEKIANLGFRTMVTAEPLMQFDHSDMVSFIKRCQPRLVAIGRNTRRDIILPEPTSEEVLLLVDELKKCIPKVHIKDNHNGWDIK
jgi:DNA repair photolyase